LPTLAESAAFLGTKLNFLRNFFLIYVCSCFRSFDKETVAVNLIFNLPLALMMLAALIVLTFWIEIYTRCIELASQFKSSDSRSWTQTLLSKPAMCASRSSWHIGILLHTNAVYAIHSLFYDYKFTHYAPFAQVCLFFRYDWAAPRSRSS
jgi:hypothetical protein